MDKFFQKLKEPSTIKGLVVLAALAGINIDAELQNQILVGAGVLYGLIQVFVEGATSLPGVSLTESQVSGLFYYLKRDTSVLAKEAREKNPYAQRAARTRTELLQVLSDHLNKRMPLI